MTRQDYMTRFSHAARWFLPLEEADEAVADYDELFSEGERTETEVCRALGDPVKAASLLRDRKRYRAWMAVFCLLTLCTVLPLLWLLRPRWYFSPTPLMAVTGLLGGLVALAWFRRSASQTRRGLPKALPLALGGMLTGAVLGAAAVAAIWWAWTQQRIPAGSVGGAVRWVLCGCGLLAFLAAMAGLVGARLSDRRWRSLYLLGLALLLVCAALMAMLTSMDMDAGSHSMVRVLSQIGGMGLVGLAVAGVSLC